MHQSEILLSISMKTMMMSDYSFSFLSAVFPTDELLMNINDILHPIA